MICLIRGLRNLGNREQSRYNPVNVRVQTTPDERSHPMPVLKPYQPDPERVRALESIVGPDHVSTADPTRIEYGRDCHAISILYLTEGKVHHPPDFVVWPGSVEQVQALVRYAAAEHVPVIPFGAGSGVCRGTDPIHGGIVLDLKRMRSILELDEESLLVHVQSGLMGQNFEMELNRRGYTFGHFPSSIYCSTVGGWVATRSAGQLSTKYGKIEDMVHSMTVVLPDGEVLRTRNAPGTSTGPDLDQIFTGSEGTLGVITDVTLRIHPAPEERIFAAFNFPDVEAGTDAIRRILAKDVFPAAVRLYDELDTLLVGKSGKSGGGVLDFMPRVDVAKTIRSLVPGLRKSASRAVMARAKLVNRLPNVVSDGCLLVLTFEGNARIVDLESSIAHSVCDQTGGKPLGPDPARHWWENRYHVSFKQSKVFDSGAFVDTIEVATTWDKLMPLYRTVKEQLAPLAFVMAHFSHAYIDGASIYFTFVGTASGADEARQVHHRVWAAAMEACERVGATISHHHGVGLLKAQWMPQELEQAWPIHRALKDVIDPENIMNPGKLGL